MLTFTYLAVATVESRCIYHYCMFYVPFGLQSDGAINVGGAYVVYMIIELYKCCLGRIERVKYSIWTCAHVLMHCLRLDDYRNE